MFNIKFFKFFVYVLWFSDSYLTFAKHICSSVLSGLSLRQRHSEQTFSVKDTLIVKWLVRAFGCRARLHGFSLILTWFFFQHRAQTWTLGMTNRPCNGTLVTPWQKSSMSPSLTTPRFLDIPSVAMTKNFLTLLLKDPQGHERWLVRV